MTRDWDRLSVLIVTRGLCRKRHSLLPPIAVVGRDPAALFPQLFTSLLASYLALFALWIWFCNRIVTSKSGLYSVVVSTLVFEMVHISNYYRWPGFEPQYDLSFLPPMRTSSLNFIYTTWVPYISALKWCIGCLNWTGIGWVMWLWSGRKQIQTKTFCRCCYWCYLWREIPRRMKEPLLRFNVQTLLLYLQNNVRSRSMTFRFKPSTTFLSAAVL